MLYHFGKHLMSEKKSEPRQIIDESPNRHPYGPKVGIILDVGDELGFNDQACLLVDDDKSIVRISPLQDESQLGRQQPQKLDVYVEGFATEGEAEQKGLKLSLALLWAAVSRKHPLRLDIIPHDLVWYTIVPKRAEVDVW